MDTGPPKTELDSHANMPVFGKHCHVFDSTHKRSCDVEPYDKNLGVARAVTIVDAALAYSCPHSLKTYVLIAKNVLYVPTLEHNLIAPFILRESGAFVNETPKIQVNSPSIHDHSIYYQDHQLRIPLRLKGIFSYFETRKPTQEEIEGCDKIFITPDSYHWEVWR